MRGVMTSNRLCRSNEADAGAWSSVCYHLARERRWAGRGPLLAESAGFGVAGIFQEFVPGFGEFCYTISA